MGAGGPEGAARRGESGSSRLPAVQPQPEEELQGGSSRRQHEQPCRQQPSQGGAAGCCCCCFAVAAMGGVRASRHGLPFRRCCGCLVVGTTGTARSGIGWLQGDCCFPPRVFCSRHKECMVC